VTSNPTAPGWSQVNDNNSSSYWTDIAA
jgi:hypothetical protein